MRNHAEIAKEFFLKGYNCAQAVCCAFADEMGFSEEQAARLVSSLGGGMGRLREVCGAVSGALVVLGYLNGYSEPGNDTVKMAHYKQVQDFAARFRTEYDTIICRELLQGIELQHKDGYVPDARTPEYYKTRPCIRFVEAAGRILDEMLYGEE